MNTEQQIKTAMPELRARYAKRLRTQSDELLGFIANCKRDDLSEESRREAHVLVHNLRGTGTTFGYPEISQAASSLETALEADLSCPPADYLDLSMKLFRACCEAAGQVSDSERSADAGPDVESGYDADKAALPTLLVVSEDNRTAETVSEVFASQMDVVRTASMVQAIDLIKLGVPTAIIFDMDSHAPTVGETLEELYSQARSTRIPVIALVPNRRAAAIAHAVSTGHIHCILKPLSTDQLYSSTRATIEQARLFALLGDDDVIVRELMSARFRASGFAVMGAKDGAQVLELAIRHRPSIIVLDRIMPGLEGLAVLQMLKANPATNAIPVIMLTAKRKVNEITEARFAGAADYIVKPFVPDFVVSRCLKVLGRMN